MSHVSRGGLAGVVAFGVVATCLLAGFAASSGSSDAARPLSLDRTTQGRGATGKIVFVVKRDFVDAPSDLWVVNADGSGLRRLTRTTVNEYDPVWSPDGRLIAFRASQPFPNHNNRRLVVMNADGTGRRALTQVREAALFAAWSRDGQRILYSGVYAPSGEWEVLVMDADGRRTRRPARTPLSGSRYVAWTPDGRTIAHGGSGGLRIAAAPTGGSRLVARGGEVKSVSFAPSGRYLAWEQSAGVYIGGPDGSNRHRLPGDQHYLGPWPWSPDGRHLLILRREYPGGGLYSVAPSTRRERRLAGDSVNSAAWSPDGRHIVYQDNFELWTLALQTGTRRRIATPPGDYVYSEPAWTRSG
jgi:Tol biopolymer transport system component